MPKPWAKYEVGYIDHDKFKAINANAICLWVEGKNYCDGRLTDGLIPAATAKTFRFHSKKAIAMLTASAGLKPGTDQHYAPLWDVVEGFGFKMHDYLQHNDCREVAIERIAKADEERAKRAEHQRLWRERQKQDRRKATVTDNAPDNGADNAPVTDPITRDQRLPALPGKQQQITAPEIRNQQQAVKEQPLSVLPRARESDDDLGDRARELLEHYPVWYAQERHGARLPLLGGNLQWHEAQTLCKTWDDSRLEKLARVILSDQCEEPFIVKSDRGWKIFVLKAAWADSVLREWEIKNACTA